MERSVRILILGDPGVGKSTLASLLSGTPNSCEKWTVGCNVTVCLHHHQSRSSSSSYSSSSSSKPVFVELFDVGSCKHKQSRALFYRHVDGAILVHDTTNGKSHQNLWKWIIELQTSDSFKKVATSSSSSSLSSSSSSFNTNFSSSSSDHPSSSIPMLIVGTKIDLAVTDYAIRNLKSSIAEEYGADSLIMSSSSFGAVQDQFQYFFDRVIDRRHYKSSSSPTRSLSGTEQHPSFSPPSLYSQGSSGVVGGSIFNRGSSHRSLG